MSGGSKTQTTTTNNAPWGAAQPALKLGLARAEKVFRDDPMGQKNIYTGSTVVPWSSQTKYGMNLVQDVAQDNAWGRGASKQYQDIINQGGLTDPQQGALKNLQGMPADGLTAAQRSAMQGMSNTVGAGGYNAATRGALGGLQAMARDPFNEHQDAALRNTQNTANSRFDVNANPAFQQVLQQAQGAARDSVNLSAGGAGRYGSGVHQGNLASEVGDLTARMVGNEYNNWQNRRDTANQNLFTMGQTGIGTQMAANQGAGSLGQNALANVQNAQNNLFNMGQSGLANRMNTQNAIFGMGQQGIGNLGTAYQGLSQPAQDMMQVGAMNEDLATRQMNDKLRVFNDTQNAPWNQIARLNAVASGAGSLGGTQTQSQPGQNPFLTALGYGTTGLGLLGGLF
ncbi:hypothetical protein [Sinorhizobium meliloti]|uniref:hypothetical protein n=1 Tax=Rhizobium meliloti TaxID=382 RepID=UPI000FDC105B|nr:hypothetical protein [Sinorhizobium meliloti]RVI91826.1 hypothetical protein CN190_03530 [Sinorhizobium meliloti]